MGLRHISELQLSRVASLVGAGGKTTLMYFLADRLAKERKRVLVTTTTHILRPGSEVFASTAEEVRKRWQQGKFAVIGSRSAKPGKLTEPDPDFLNQIMQEADFMLVEADGAKHFPIKVPRQQEPVFLPQTEQVIAVMGLCAIGQPLFKCCFGLEGAKILLGAEEEHILTEEDAAQVLASELGGQKNVGNARFCVVLNQCDDENKKLMAQAIASRLHSMGVEDVYTASFDSSQQKFYNDLAGASDNEAK